MTDAIYRFTNPGDTYGSISNANKIEFLPGAVPDASGRNIKTDFKMRRDVNPHPNPRRALNKIQDSLLGMMEVVVTGYFVNHSTTLGPKNFFNWSVDEAVNDDFEWGRFGLTLDSFANGLLNVLPTSTKGYILYDIIVEDVEKPRDEVPFIAKFYRNGAIAVIP
jgi:hypothetical protein